VKGRKYIRKDENGELHMKEKKANKALHSTPATRGFSVDVASAAPEDLSRLLLAHVGGGSE
jgi:hypothetical protein